MSKQTLISLFGEYLNEIAISESAKNAKILKCNLERDKRSLLVLLKADEPICEVDFHLLKTALSSALNLNEIKIDAEIDEAARPKIVSNAQPRTPTKSAQNGKKVNADSKVLMGKKITKTPMKLSEITPYNDSVTVGGTIFEIERRSTKFGDKIGINFAINDGTYSFKARMFLKNDDAKALDNLKKGDCVLLQGKVSEDDFLKELVLRPFDINLTEKVKREDNATTKRVELHLHTNMSSMDGISDVSDLINRAADFGHSAVAITDHEGIQSFPDAMYAKENLARQGKEIKIIYGVEANMVDDGATATTSGDSDEIKMADEYIIFDVETTGLSAFNNRLTEIGAVKIRNGEVIDKFSTFVNPEQPIPPKITEITGITQAMVQDAPLEGEALKSFLNFAGECTLVAHNAPFDMGFIRATCTRADVKYSPNVIDTVVLARQIMPNLPNHKLNTIAKAMNLGEFNHHRALDDAEILSRIFMELISKLPENCAESKTEKVELKRLPSNHITILAKNLEGLKNLYKLISIGHLEHFFKRAKVPRGEIKRYRNGLIIGSACEAGELYEAVMKNASRDELLKIAKFYDYLEIMPLGNNKFMLEKGIVQNLEEIQDFNRQIISLGDELKIPVVATGDVHFLDEKDAISREILQTSLGFKDASNQAPLYFKTTDEMLADFAYLGEEKAHEVVITNTNLIADMVEDIRPIPKGAYPPSIEGSDEDLERIVYKRAHEVYGENLPEIVKKRVEKELNAIISNGFSVMYISAQRVVEDSVKNGYLVGSRGSIGSSFVATLAEITEVNPLDPHYVCAKCKFSEFITDASVGSGFDLPEKSCPTCGENLIRDGHKIPFETFMGFKGEKVPDIDLNFSGEYQEQSHKFTEELFGKDNVFRAGTISVIQDKTAYGFVKNFVEEKGMTANRTHIGYLISGIVGVRRTTGQHPGGMIVVPKSNDIHDFTPIQFPANNADKGAITTHFAFEALHDTILKLDMLGHDTPTIYKYLEDFTGVNVMNVPMSDENVMSLFTSSEALNADLTDIGVKTGTLSLPEVGTNFVQEMLLESNPKTFSDLLQISGLSHGTDVWLGNAQELIKKGICTISEVIGTRDNIMVYLMERGLDPSDAFNITEIVRKGQAANKLTQEHLTKMKEAGVPKWYLESCMKIKYMFPKAHAAAYMISALRLGYYKIYHPKEYYAAYLTGKPEGVNAIAAARGKASTLDIINKIKAMGKQTTAKEKKSLSTMQVVFEAIARGVNFLKVDLQKSHYSRFLVEDDGIRLPFGSLEQAGGIIAEGLYKATREKQDFISREELQALSGAPKPVMEGLAEIGALENLPETNQVSFF